MTAHSVMYTPFDLSDAVPAGRKRFWKQILPVTSIDYKGTKVDFDPAFHQDLNLSFEQGAYDQVPIVFADEGNRHNMDPRNFGGEIVKTEYRGPGKDQGTWALIEADRSAARAIRRNPKLGVSARIIQGIQKADGRSFRRAINHVLLTMNPRVSGMEPWQAVDLSEDTEIEVVDLTAETYQEGTNMARGTKIRASRRRQVEQIDLSALSDDDFQRLLDLAATATEDETDVDPDEIEDEDDADTGDVEVPGRRTKKSKSKKKITIENESEEDADDEGDEDDDEDEDATDLSESAGRARKVIDRETRNTVRGMQIDLAEERWQTARGEYVRAGVPPFLLDLAEPILASPDEMVLDLADGDDVDVVETITKMLDGVRGLIDLSDEIGHQVDLSEGINDQDPDKAYLDEWDRQY